MTLQELFTNAYLEAIDFTETGDRDQPPPGSELTSLSRCDALRDCRNFWWAYGDLIASEHAEQAGHDFWLTRNGHGTGFWDRPEVYGETLSNQLDRASRACGGVYVDFKEEALWEPTASSLLGQRG